MGASGLACVHTTHATPPSPLHSPPACAGVLSEGEGAPCNSLLPCLLALASHAEHSMCLPAPLARPQLYLSQEQAKAMHGNNSQGPVYKPYAAIGPQPESKYNTAPALGFGTSARSAKDKRGAYPGPGVWAGRTQRAQPSTHCAQPSSRAQHECGDVHLRTCTCAACDPRPALPCPAGTYSQGPDVESKRSTSPRTVFGTSTRDKQAKVGPAGNAAACKGGAHHGRHERARRVGGMVLSVCLLPRAAGVAR